MILIFLTHWLIDKMNPLTCLYKKDEVSVVTNASTAELPYVKLKICNVRNLEMCVLYVLCLELDSAQVWNVKD